MSYGKPEKKLKFYRKISNFHQTCHYIGGYSHTVYQKRSVVKGMHVQWLPDVPPNNFLISKSRLNFSIDIILL